MSLKLAVRQRGGVIIVDASGMLVLGEGASALRNEIRALVDGGTRWILVNMEEVSYIDCSGVGELAAAHTTVTASGGEIKLLNLTRRSQDLLNVTKLCTIFETFEDEALALKSFPVTPAEIEIMWAKFMNSIFTQSADGSRAAAHPGRVKVRGQAR